MNCRLLPLVWLLCAVAPAAHALVEHKVRQKFTAPAAGAVLQLDTFSGAINLTETDGDAIEISVTEQCNVKDEKEAAPLLADLDLTLKQDKDGHVIVRASYRRKVSFTWQNWPPVLLTFDIKVPRRCDAELHTTNGDITVGKLTGKLKVINESGKIFIGETDGTVTVRSNAGEIGVTACTGRVDAASVTGNISIGRALGGARLASDGGEIEVQQAGGDFRVSGNGSSVKVRFVHPLTRAADVATSGGNIIAIFDQRSAANIEASAAVLEKVTTRGLAPAGVPDGEARSHFSAKLNGGGLVVALSASGGRIQLRGEALVLPEPAPAQ